MTASDTSQPTTCRCGEWPISEYGPVCPSCIADDYTAALDAALPIFRSPAPAPLCGRVSVATASASARPRKPSQEDTDDQLDHSRAPLCAGAP
jgi:hypothetical protein